MTTNVSMVIYVIRHGDAEGNKEGRLLGQVDPPLTGLGKQQAALLAAFFAPYGLRQIGSSDLGRARETAEIIAEKLGLSVRTTPELREVNQGLIDGWYATAIKNSPYGPEREKDKYNFRAPGGESYHDIEGRISRAMFATDPRPALIVTHAGPMRILLHLLGGWTQSEAAAAKIDHFDMIELANIDGRWRCELIPNILGSMQTAEAA